MEKMKQWIALTVVGVLAVMAAGWFLLISPKRAEAADIRLDVQKELSETNQLRTELAMLKAQQKTLPQVQARLAAVAAKIPDNPALPALIRALTKAADETGVELISLAPGKPTAVAGAVAATPVTPTATGAKPATTGATRTSSGSVSATTAATAAGTAAAGVLTSIPVTVNVVGGFFQVEQFFDRVESITRAMKVTAFTLGNGVNPLKRSLGGTTAQEDGKTLIANITASVYMAPGRVNTAPAAITPVAGK